MKLIIAGSRSCTDMNLLLEAIASLPEKGAEVTEVVCGMAKGADTLGYEWAKSKGIPIKEMPADWSKVEGGINFAAGMIRNRNMACYCGPDDMLIALWDGRSRGTANMIDEAHMRKMAVLICRFEPRTSTDDDAPKDEAKMTFGKYGRENKTYGEVPASYWWWLWDNGMRDKQGQDAYKYIVKNWSKLAKEHPGFKDEIPPQSHH
jgi:hypothetical protein